MTVLTSPKDQGPIRTDNRHNCQHCENTVWVSGGTVRKEPNDKRRSWQSYGANDYGVCPYCDHHISRRNALILEHDSCNTVIPRFKSNWGKGGKVMCPECGDEWTDENTTVVTE